MSPVRVAHVVTSGGVGGAQRHIALLTPLLRPEFECEVASGPGEWLPRLLAERGVSHHLIPDLDNRLGVSNFKAFGGIYDWLKRGSFQLLHAHSTKAGLLGRIAARLLGLPTVFTAHGFAFADPGRPSWQRTAWAVVEKGLGMTTDSVITVSDADLQIACRLGVQGRIATRLIWNGIDVAAWRPSCRGRVDVRCALGIGLNEFLVGTVTRLVPEKAPETFVRALAFAPGVTGLVVGDGPLRSRLSNLATDLALNERIRWLGDRDDIRTCLHAMDVFTLASRKEGAPYALLEAMAAGLVPVVTAVGGMPAMVGRYGLVVPPGRPDLLAAAWCRARDLPPPPPNAVPDVTRQAAATAALYREVLARTV